MRQHDFEALHAPHWDRLESMLQTLDSKTQAGAAQLATFPRAYHQVCQHLALARERQYAPHLIDRLDAIVQGCYRHLYRARGLSRYRVLDFLTTGFPVLVRAEWRLVALSSALLYLPMLVMGLAVYFAPHMVYTVLDPATVGGIESMYDPKAEHIGRERGSDSDFMMFGHYIMNNIGISFQVFAGGLLGGLGSVFYLVYNGVYLGAVAGHLTQVEYTSTFYSFVVGHGAFELTAIALSGAAGLRLGLSLIAPGRKTRLHALRDAADTSIRIMYGVATMLLLAAFVEAFWSSTQAVSPAVKHGVGAVLWLLVGAYLLGMGRGRAA